MDRFSGVSVLQCVSDAGVDRSRFVVRRAGRAAVAGLNQRDQEQAEDAMELKRAVVFAVVCGVRASI